MQLAAAAEAERAQLADLSVFLRNALLGNGFDIAGSESHIVPIVLGSNDAAVAYASLLQSRGYGIRAIRPPTVPAHTARLRFSLHADLSDENLEYILTILKKMKNVK